MRAKPYHHGNLKVALLELALAQLEEGVLDLSLRDLARGLGVSPNAPYRHFPTKEALLTALADIGFAKLQEQLESVKEEGPMKRFRSLAETFTAFASHSPQLFRLMFDFGTDAEEPNSRETCFRIVQESVRVLMDEVTVTDQVKEATAGAWCLFFGMATLRVGQGIPDCPEVDPREIARYLGRGIKN